VASYYRQIVSGKNYRYWWPLRYHDFCPMSDGAAAVILTSRPQDIMVAGVGSATDIPTIADRNYFHSFPATVNAAARAYGMAGLKDIRTLAGRLHVNMHDPFNGFGPINLVDLGVLPPRNLLDGLLRDDLTGENGAFPTNLTGGLKGRGHPLGATGMIQVVENHRLIREKGFKAGLSHSIGGPINNNVVILLEEVEHYDRRSHQRFKPWGLPPLGRIKPKEVTVEALLASGAVDASYVTGTTQYHHRDGSPQLSILIVACKVAGQQYRFLFGVSGEHCSELSGLTPGDRVRMERQDGEILVNRIPVRRFYQKSFQGMMEKSGVGWKKLTGKG
jgi:acetyl-CoA C-acetyltransferase